MPKLERWIIASKKIPVLSGEILSKIIDAGGEIGGGWCQIHQHILVNEKNKESIEKILRNENFDISDAGDSSIYHPECLKIKY